MTELTGAEWSTSLIDTWRDFPEDFLDRANRSPHRTRHRLASLERDPRFETQYVVASRDGSPIVAISLAWPRHASWPDADYDPSRQFGGSRSANDYVLVGGRSDFRCETLTVLDQSQLVSAGTLALLHRTAQVCSARGRRAVLMYSGDSSLLARAARSCPGTHDVEIAQRFSIDDVGGGWEDYLSRLDGRRRRVVRRDVRDIESAQMESRVTTWDEVLPWAPDSVAAVNSAYGPSHPALVRRRLDTWSSDPDSEPVAFVCGRAGCAPDAVSLGWIYDDTLELYEVGLPPVGSPDRLLRYLEVMFYAPLRMMWTRRLRRLDLALASGKTKTLRGAVGHSLLALQLAP